MYIMNIMNIMNSAYSTSVCIEPTYTHFINAKYKNAY